jgi:hypothetical protein
MHGAEEFGLEISGTTMMNLESRHREKVQQLRANPMVRTALLLRSILRHGE